MNFMPPLNVRHLRRQRGLAQFHASAGFVEKIDGLVRQEAIRNIAIRKIHGRFDRFVGVIHHVEFLVPRLHALQNPDGFALAGRADLHGLEAAFERTVLFDRFAVFRGRRRADALDLTARKRRLQDVCGIERTFGRTCADERVQFVDEHDGVRIVDQFFHDRLQPLFKLAAILRSGNDQRKIQNQNALVRQEGRNFAVDDALRKSFDNGGLSDAGIADQNRIVLGPAAEDLNDAIDFRIAADQRIENAVHRGLRQIARELAEQRRFFRLDQRLAVDNRSSQFLADRVQTQSALVQDFRSNALLFAQNSQQQVLGADMAMIQPLRFFGGVGENSLALVRKRQIDRRRHLLANGRPAFDLLANALDRGRIAKKPIGQVLVFTDQAQQQVFGFDRRAAELAGLVASKEDDPTCSFRISFKHMFLFSQVPCMRPAGTCFTTAISVNTQIYGCLDSKRCASRTITLSGR